MKEETTEYIPFGEEWEKEISKMPKRIIIDMLRKVNQERISNYKRPAKVSGLQRIKQLERVIKWALDNPRSCFVFNELQEALDNPPPATANEVDAVKKDI